MRVFLSGVVVGILTFLPLGVVAAPFGGQIGAGPSCKYCPSGYCRCYNRAIYSALGPPRGGEFIWTPSTITYQFGPPAHVGQWLLGLSGAPYYCLVSVAPILVCSGASIFMMGSSQ